VVPYPTSVTMARFGIAVARTASTKVLTASGPKALSFLAAFLSCAHRRTVRPGRWRNAHIVICAGLTWLSLGQICQAADGQSARDIVAGVARLFISKSSTATVEMQIIKPDFQRKILMEFWSLGESKILVRIRQPAEDAGTAILKVDDQAWMYLPKADRTVAMPASMMTTPWMGSDFTLNDLVNQARLIEDYAITTAFAAQRDGVAVTGYTLTPKPAAAVVWGKIILEIRQSDLMPVWQHYYDENGTLVRELTFSDYAYAGGRLIPTRLVMRPMQRPGEYTKVTYDSVRFDVPISETMFSLKSLRP
jgi:outer membrane lipoprotein-sorting protein